MANPLFPYQRGFSATWAGRPRRLVTAERELWQWWREEFGKAYQEFWFDVPLDGQPAREKLQPTFADTLSPKWRKVWKDVTSKRADVIALQGSTYHIIELRSEVKPETLGEIQQYVTLAKLEHPNLVFGRPVLIANKVDEITRRYLLAGNIELFLKEMMDSGQYLKTTQSS